MIYPNNRSSTEIRAYDLLALIQSRISFLDGAMTLYDAIQIDKIRRGFFTKHWYMKYSDAELIDLTMTTINDWSCKRSFQYQPRLEFANQMKLLADTALNSNGPDATVKVTVRDLDSLTDDFLGHKFSPDLVLFKLKN